MAELAKIDGRLVSKPVITIDKNIPGIADTAFTVESTTPYGSKSKYKVHLKGLDDSYYTYEGWVKEGETDDGFDILVKNNNLIGNNQDTLNRHRQYLKQLKGNDYWGFWKRFFNTQPNIPLKKSFGGKLVKINGKLVEVTE